MGFKYQLGLDFYRTSTEGGIYEAEIVGGSSTSINGNNFWDKDAYMAVRAIRSF